MLEYFGTQRRHLGFFRPVLYEDFTLLTSYSSKNMCGMSTSYKTLDLLMLKLAATIVCEWFK